MECELESVVCSEYSFIYFNYYNYLIWLKTMELKNIWLYNLKFSENKSH